MKRLQRQQVPTTPPTYQVTQVLHCNAFQPWTQVRLFLYCFKSKSIYIQPALQLFLRPS